jgi:hypothetical protein
MYATSADWSLDQVADFSELGPKMAASMKAAGAVHWHFVITSETTARSIMVWPDKETAHKAIKMFREDASVDNGSTITSTCEGEIVAGF